MSTRAKLIWVVVVAVLTVVAVTSYVRPRLARDDAVRAVARDFAQQVAAGDPDDVERLWAMTASESPGALRTAGRLLLEAPERIEVVSVGDPQAAPEPDLNYQVELEDFTAVPVRYRLAGEEHTWTIVLGKLARGSTAEVAHWRIADPALGSVEWTAPGFTDVAVDYYLGNVRQVRRPLLTGGSDEDEQPLYPAVYAAQGRLDPYYASEEVAVEVNAGEVVTAPELDLEPTARTRERISSQVLEQIARCRPGRDLYRCPVVDIAQRAGIDVFLDDTWSAKLTRTPTVELGRGGSITVSDGELRLRGAPDGPRLVGFGGTGRYLIDNQSWRPAIFELDLEEN